MYDSHKIRVAVVGLGYVGLPVALAMASKFPTVGFDLNATRIAELRRGHDSSGEESAIQAFPLDLTSTAEHKGLREANFYIISVPTPVDAQKRPDLSALRKASATIGSMLSPGDTVVFESTVYPGVTEDVCAPILIAASGLLVEKGSVLTLGEFHLGYSPERICPGEKERTFKKITKVISAADPVGLDILGEVYGKVVDAGVHRASSIRVAEASKVVENIQRDVNIALINELAVIFDAMGIETSDVLDASSTKWNWLPFKPGLVGGHCIGVDPYYMAAVAEGVGVPARVIMSGRRMNDYMATFVADRTVRELALSGAQICDAEVLILGAAFKEGVGDIRNSKAFDVATVLTRYGARVRFYDPLVANEAVEAAGWPAVNPDELRGHEPVAVILAVPHSGLVGEAKALAAKPWVRVLIDVRGAIDSIPANVRYWRL